MTFDIYKIKLKTRRHSGLCCCLPVWRRRRRKCLLGGRWRRGSRCRWPLDQEAPAADCRHKQEAETETRKTQKKKCQRPGSRKRPFHTEQACGRVFCTSLWSGEPEWADIWRNWSSLAVLSAGEQSKWDNHFKLYPACILFLLDGTLMTPRRKAGHVCTHICIWSASCKKPLYPQI